MSDEMRVAGLLLAAGAGSRLGYPKALVRGPADGDSPGEAWVVRGARVLLDSGCSAAVVVVGARAAEVSRLIVAAFPHEPRLLVQRAEFWSEGMSASLRAGLVALQAVTLDGVVVTLVDTPSLRVETVRRTIGAAAEAERVEHALVQATFGGRPGHPVFLGRAHWAGLSAQLSGDNGARAYLVAHSARPVECSDLESGEDIDKF